jgi:hypothetical protein
LQAEHLTAAQAVDERELHRQADAVVANSIEKLTALLHGECPAFLGADRGGRPFILRQTRTSYSQSSGPSTR